MLRFRLLPGRAPLPLPKRQRGEERASDVGLTAEGDALAWTLDKIKNRLPIMLIRCEAEDIARQVDQRDIDAALPKIVAWAETKTHNRR